MSQPLRVDLIVYPGFKALEAIETLSVFEYANHHLLQHGRPRGYALRIVAPQAGRVASDMPMALEAAAPLSLQDLPDLAVIVGVRDIDSALQRQPALVDWVRAAAPRLPTLVALCTGCFFLAAAGLLDGQPATTHWSAVPLLRARFPAVRVEPDRIHVRAGRIWTSAGVTAGMDLALALVEEHHGRALALEVARDLVMYLKRPGGQSQFSVHLQSQGTDHPGIRAAQDWVLAHLDQPLPLAELAARALMSERNFRRQFGRAVGQSPARFIEDARLEAARRLLEDSELPQKTVAARVGFASEQALRKLFARRLGVSPQDYRARFGGSAG
ncbi:GlxA family transcriptional regulator [Pelomonas sp. CA6]|uniref:GlxA family transcriptional regulator n=1 Tax=Pelomonas sp. CA6 TaxID=2907999 RepID=UPI001F4C0543|nr:GlxA family transcriptional regulator [Pelomonas sp. CA6]MCH7343179.1 GlxA family transcriptional regulator [Pelomonas sp. CA6]